MEEEREVFCMEDLLAEALVEADRKVAEAAPGSEERERLAKEREALFKIWLEVAKQSSELTEKEKNERDSKFRKILDAVKTGGEVIWKGVQVVGSLGLALAMFRFSKGGDFMSADEMRSVGWLESLLTKG